MTAPMHTRCPQCQTIFHVTSAQLEARAGLVRCGICASAFQADQNLIETLPNNHRAAHTPAADEIARTDPIERTVTGPPNSPADDDLPLMNEFPLVPERSSTPTAVVARRRAAAGAARGPGGVFLRTATRARRAPQAVACALLRTRRLRPQTAARDIVDRAGLQTSVAPHPRYENALRLSAVLVNRAEQAQPYPVMEVSLTDSEVRCWRAAVSRRQYLESPAAHGALAPNVAVRAHLDVTNADGRAVGYEIRLVTSPE